MGSEHIHFPKQFIFNFGVWRNHDVSLVEEKKRRIDWFDEGRKKCSNWLVWQRFKWFVLVRNLCSRAQLLHMKASQIFVSVILQRQKCVWHEAVHLRRSGIIRSLLSVGYATGIMIQKCLCTLIVTKSQLGKLWIRIIRASISSVMGHRPVTRWMENTVGEL